MLGYSTVNAGFSILPAAIFMILVAPSSAKLVETRGARFTLLLGYVFVLLGFLTMLLLWNESIPYWMVGLGYSFVGIGVGLAGTPASRSLTSSVPVTRAGMASGTADLQRDLGGAIMQITAAARRGRGGPARGAQGQDAAGLGRAGHLVVSYKRAARTTGECGSSKHDKLVVSTCEQRKQVYGATGHRRLPAIISME